MDFDEIFWRGRAWLKDQVVQFWWRSGSRFGSESPKSEILILRIGGGLYSLSISSLCMFLWYIDMQCEIHNILNAVDDETRVKLKGLSHDYINANYVNVRVVSFLHSLKGYVVILSPFNRPQRINTSLVAS